MDIHARGGYRVFQKGGLRPAIRNARGGGGGGGAVRFRPDTKSGEGGGCCPFQARYKKRGEGVLSAFRPDTKSGGGGGGGGGGRHAVHLRPDTKSGGGGGAVQRFRPDTKSGKGEGLFSRRGGVTIYERGGCNPQNPPLDPPLHATVAI